MSHILRKIGIVLGITLFIAIILGFLIGIYFVGFAGLFQLLGVEYDSMLALTLFVIAFFIIGFVLDLFVNPFTKVIAEQFLSKNRIFFLQFAIEVSANWMILHAINAMMDSITINLITEIIIAVFLFLVEYMFGNDASKKESVE